MNYEAVIGLEVHVELSTQSKMFCGCSTDFHAPPNTNVCPICLGMPGVLPVINQAAVDAGIAVGLALNCTVSQRSKMDRKNYFYPDLAKNFQISQYDLPLCHDGWLEIDLNGAKKRIRINRAHLEEDTARNVHNIGDAESGVDFNRSGIPLLEIVTEPDMGSAEEAYEYLRALKQILEYLDVSDCNMEEGSLRAEANVSIRPAGTAELGTKTEIKNVASFNGTRRAVEYEIMRQQQVLEDGSQVIQETRGWDADRCVTVSQRSKESAHDYRYFPEPDLMPLAVDDAWKERIKADLPELPQARRQRFETDYGLSHHDTAILTSIQAMADYFEATVSCGAPAKPAANWIMGDLQALISESRIDARDCAVSPAHLAEMIGLIENGTISGKIAKELLADMFRTGKPAQQLVKEKGLTQISDTAQLESIVRNVIAAHPGPAADFKGGKQKALGFLVGKVMQATKGKANPKLVNDVLKQQLTE